jgi:hypothetical protein
MRSAGGGGASGIIWTVLAPGVNDRSYRVCWRVRGLYTYDFACESVYDYVYDLLHKVSNNLILDRLFLKCVYKRL